MFAALWLPVLIGLEWVPEAAELFFQVSPQPNPYWMPSHAWLVYVGVPIVVVSACVAVMTPGLWLALGVPGLRLEQWIVCGFGLTLPVVSAAAVAGQTLTGQVLTGRSFLTAVGAVSLLSAAWAVSRLARGRGSWPFSEKWLATVVCSIAVPAVLVAGLAPKFLWESFNGDGAHAMASAQIAVRKAWPFWDPSAGGVSQFPGMSTLLFAYPASWFVRVFGELEVAVRAPYLLVFTVLHSAIVLVASHGRPSLARVPQLLIWLALAVYTMTQAYSSTYDPYSADLSMPGLPDTLQVAVFLGFVHGYLARRWLWAALFVILTLTTSPAGTAMVTLWILATWWLGIDRQAVYRMCGLLVATIVGLGLLPIVLGWFGTPLPGKEHGIVGLARHFAQLQFTDWRRLGWVAIPVGIAPMLAVVAWREIDSTGRALLLTAMAYFAVFFVQAQVMIHYFVPPMLLLLVAWWRMGDSAAGPITRRRIPLTLASGLVASWLCFPANPSIVTAARIVGGSIDDRTPGYEVLKPAVFRRFDLLQQVLPSDVEPEVPGQSYGGSALAWGYYAHRPTAKGRPAYVLIGAMDRPPDGHPAHAVNEAGAVYVEDPELWAAHRALRPPTPAGSPTFWMPRRFLFGGRPDGEGPWILDLPAELRRLGIDLSELLN